MNQRRVGAAIPLVAGSALMSSGLVLEMIFHHRNNLIFLTPLYLFFASVGIWSLAFILQTANAWGWNVTPKIFERLPKGTWYVAAVVANYGPSGLVYVTIHRRSMEEAELSTLALEPEFIEITDYKSILDRKRPLTVTIGPKNISFTWPTKMPRATDGSVPLVH